MNNFRELLPDVDVENLSTLDDSVPEMMCFKELLIVLWQQQIKGVSLELRRTPCGISFYNLHLDRDTEAGEALCLIGLNAILGVMPPSKNTFLEKLNNLYKAEKK
jgi:hypothetical protein